MLIRNGNERVKFFFYNLMQISADLSIFNVDARGKILRCGVLVIIWQINYESGAYCLVEKVFYLKNKNNSDIKISRAIEFLKAKSFQTM